MPCTASREVLDAVTMFVLTCFRFPALERVWRWALMMTVICRLQPEHGLDLDSTA